MSIITDTKMTLNILLKDRLSSLKSASVKTLTVGMFRLLMLLFTLEVSLKENRNLRGMGNENIYKREMDHDVKSLYSLTLV